MSDATPAFDFSQFVPGFDFLKNLAAGAATPMASFFGRMTGASAAEPVSDDDGDGDAASAESAGDGAQPVDAPDAPDMAGSKAGVVDPLQWWGALTQQFQQIAESAMKDAAQIQMPQMPQMPDLSGAADKPAKTARSRRSATATGSTQRAPAGAARTRVASAPAARSAGTARDTPTAGRKTDGARSTRAAAKTAPRKSAAAPASARRSRG